MAVDYAGNRSDAAECRITIKMTVDISGVEIVDLNLTRAAAESRVPINIASTVSYKIVGLPTDADARAQLDIKVTINDVEVDADKYIFRDTSILNEDGTEKYYILMDADLLNTAISGQLFPARVTVRVEVSNGINSKTNYLTYYVEAYRNGFGFGRLRP